jgi:hypothetical protein
LSGWLEKLADITHLGDMIEITAVKPEESRIARVA